MHMKRFSKLFNKSFKINLFCLHQKYWIIGLIDKYICHSKSLMHKMLDCAPLQSYVVENLPVDLQFQFQECTQYMVTPQSMSKWKI